MADRPPHPGTPGWAKAFWIVTAVVVLLFVILLLARGPHGPGRHIDRSQTSQLAAVRA
jgi:hypothetical protein